MSPTFTSEAFQLYLENEKTVQWNQYPRRLRKTEDRETMSWRNKKETNAKALFVENQEKNKWHWLSCNPMAIRLIESNLHKADWDQLTQNPAAMHLLQRNKHKVNWDLILYNTSAIDFIVANHTRIRGRKSWNRLSQNKSITHLIRDGKIYLTDDLIIDVDWFNICGNPNAMEIIEANLDKISDFTMLSCNPAAVPFLERNPKLIRWNYLCGNPAAIHLIMQKKEKIDWHFLSENSHPVAIELLRANLNKVNWSKLCAYNYSHYGQEYTPFVKSIKITSKHVANTKAKRFQSIVKFEQNQQTLFQSCKVRNAYAMLKIIKNKHGDQYETAKRILGDTQMYGERLRERNYFAHDPERLTKKIQDIHLDSSKYQILQHLEYVKLELIRIYQIVLTEDYQARKLKMPSHKTLHEKIDANPTLAVKLLGQDPIGAYHDMITLRNMIAHATDLSEVERQVDWFNQTFIH